MENHEQNIDDLFRDALGDYTETPPPAVWSNLESKLAKVPRKTGYNRNVWYGLLALLVIISIPTARMINGTSGFGTNPVASKYDAANTLTPATLGTGTKNATETGNNTQAAPRASENGDNTIPRNSNATAVKNKEQHEIKGETTSAKDKITKSGTKADRTGDRAKSNPAQEPIASNGKTIPGTIHSKSTTENEKEEPENAYASNHANSNPAPIEASADETKNDNKEKETKATAKTDPVAADQTFVKHQNKPIPKPKFDRIEAGIKLGFETGFDNDGAKKTVVSPYVQFNISPKLSVMTQPAFKYAALATRRIGNANTYYKANDDGSFTQADISAPAYLDGTKYIIGYITQFHYTQTHDSIIKSSTIGGTYSETELPLLLKYRLSKSFSVYGGAELIYSRSISIKENTATYANLGVSRDTFLLTPNPNPVLSPSNSVITYTGTDISQYHGPQYTTNATNQWRVGYMLGFSYDFYKRWMFDALIQQSNVKTNYQAGYNINSALSVPYFRLTLGYKLIK